MAAIALVAVAACGPPASTPGPSAPAIQLTEAAPGSRVVDVVGVSRADLEALARTPRDQWTTVLRVVVDTAADGDVPAMSGAYAIAGDRVRFTPDFPLDARVGYRVVFQLPGAAPLELVIPPSAERKPATTRVAEVYPNDTLLENHLRMYIHFSAPMSTRRAEGYVRLLDEGGEEVVDPFLPLEVDLWNADRTRFTLLFDPGRVKRGILPNREMGRPLKVGNRYRLVVDREWPDAEGAPLVESFSREFRIVGEVLEPIVPSEWRLAVPGAGTRDPLTVTFERPLDHALAQRTIWVEASGGAIGGAVAVDAATTRWSFAPSEPWRAGSYRLRATSDLEDPAGNRIGRAFDYDAAQQGEEGLHARAEASLPFTVKDR